MRGRGLLLGLILWLVVSIGAGCELIVQARACLSIEQETY